MKATPAYFRHESDVDNDLVKKLSNARNRFRYCSVEKQTPHGTVITGSKLSVFKSMVQEKPMEQIESGEDRSNITQYRQSIGNQNNNEILILDTVEQQFSHQDQVVDINMASPVESFNKSVKGQKVFGD